MEHYKLIREYPGSLKLGTVVEAPEDCQTLFIIEDGVCFTYDQGLLDRYPEYWEKEEELNKRKDEV